MSLFRAIHLCHIPIREGCLTHKKMSNINEARLNDLDPADAEHVTKLVKKFTTPNNRVHKHFFFGPSTCFCDYKALSLPSYEIWSDVGTRSGSFDSVEASVKYHSESRGNIYRIILLNRWILAGIGSVEKYQLFRSFSV